MKFAYADPPYPGCANLHYKNDPSGIEAKEVDHEKLIGHLVDYESWALSTSSVALKQILPFCPDGSRIGAWVKPFAVFRPNVRVAYSWEPVIFYGSRKQENREEVTIHDWVSAMPPIFTKRNLDGTKGQKPIEFCIWLFNIMGLREGDELVDLFPGSGAVGIYWNTYISQGQLIR